MFYFVLQVLQRTPAWVWLLLGALVYLGYLQSRTRAQSRARLLVLPFVMGCLSLYGVWSVFGANVIAYGALVFGVALSVLANQALRFPRGVVYSPSDGTFTIPGSWTPFALIMLIFLVRYGVTVAVIVNPWLRSLGGFVSGMSILYGLFSGVFIARTLHTLHAANRFDEPAREAPVRV